MGEWVGRGLFRDGLHVGDESVMRAIARHEVLVVHGEWDGVGDEQEVDAFMVQKRHETCLTPVEQLLGTAHEDSGHLGSRH
jgi:hypothetical protein